MGKKRIIKYPIVEFNKHNPVAVSKGKIHIYEYLINTSDNPEAMRAAIIESLKQQT